MRFDIWPVLCIPCQWYLRAVYDWYNFNLQTLECMHRTDFLACYFLWQLFKLSLDGSWFIIFFVSFYVVFSRKLLCADWGSALPSNHFFPGHLLVVRSCFMLHSPFSKYLVRYRVLAKCASFVSSNRSTCSL